MGAIAGGFGYILNFLYNLVQNYGLAIILFSILLKIVMSPITLKQQSSMEKNAKMQEETKKLQVKFKNNPEKLNEETLQLYKREHFSPFSGCLSAILQFLIFLSVFYLVSRPLTYMKKVDSTLITKYEQEITEAGEQSSYPEIKVIEEKSAEDSNVYINMEFLGLDLSKVPMQNWQDLRVFVIPALYVLTTFASIKLNNKLMNGKKKSTNTKESTDKNEEKVTESVAEDQMESMQQMTNSMNYMMPIMSIGIAIIAPLGLSLYWFISNLLQLLERISIDFFKKMKKGKEEA